MRRLLSSKCFYFVRQSLFSFPPDLYCTVLPSRPLCLSRPQSVMQIYRLFVLLVAGLLSLELKEADWGAGTVSHLRSNNELHLAF